MLVLIALLALSPPAIADAVVAGATGETVSPYQFAFRAGTLADLPDAAVLRYSQTIDAVTISEKSRQGDLQLSVTSLDTGRLILLKDGRTRHIGDFPASVGNPLAMYFLESVIRDLAARTGGSPFYLRNRIKEALRRPEPVTHIGQAPRISEIVLRPFPDEMRSKMGAYTDLVLRISASEQLPGWYSALEAVAAEASPPYRFRIELMTEH